MLQIDELKGTKPTEAIYLTSKRLGVASAIIIASCIQGNGVLKELECSAAPVSAFLSAPADTPALSPSPHACSQSLVEQTPPWGRSRSRRGPEGQLRAAITSVRHPRSSPCPRGFAFASAPIDTPILSLFPSCPVSQARGQQYRSRGRLRARCRPQGDEDRRAQVRLAPPECVFAFMSTPVEHFLTPASTPVLAVCGATTSVQKEQLLSWRPSASPT